MNEVVRPEIDSTGELLARAFNGGELVRCVWANTHPKVGFSSRVDDRQDREGFARAVRSITSSTNSTAVSGVVMLATCGVSRIFGCSKNG